MNKRVFSFKVKCNYFKFAVTPCCSSLVPGNASFISCFWSTALLSSWSSIQPLFCHLWWTVKCCCAQYPLVSKHFGLAGPHLAAYSPHCLQCLSNRLFIGKSLTTAKVRVFGEVDGHVAFLIFRQNKWSVRSLANLQLTFVFLIKYDHDLRW